MDENKALIRFRVPLFLGGINDSARADLIKDDELTVCDNFFVSSDGELIRRKDFDAYPDPILATITGNLVRIWVWKSTFLPAGATVDDRDYLLLVYSDNGDLWLLHYNGTGWVTSIPATGFIFEGLGEPRITKTDIGLSIVDGREGELAKTIEIRPDNTLIYGDIGLPAPLSLMIMSNDDGDNNYVPMDSFDPGMAISRGSILFAVYTMVTDDGLESNPSPLFVSTDLQYLKLDDELTLVEFWQRALLRRLRTVMADKTLAPGLLDSVKYFNIYLSNTLYTEGVVGLSDLHFASRIAISQLLDDNEYVSTSPFAGLPVSYENDQSCKGDDICYTGGITFISNANTAIQFPFPFAHYFKITLQNKNSRNYVNAPIWIRLHEDDLKDAEGTLIIDWSAITVGDLLIAAEKNRIRLFDSDLTTMLHTCYIYSTGNDYIDVMVKIPYIPGYLSKDIYLAYGSTGIPAAVGTQTKFRDEEYGDWVDIRTEWADQLILSFSRVRNNRFELCCSNERTPAGHVDNRADINRNLVPNASLGWGTLSPFPRIMGMGRTLSSSAFYSHTGSLNTLYVHSEEDILLKLPQKGYVTFRYGVAHGALGNDGSGTWYDVFHIHYTGGFTNYIKLQRQVQPPPDPEVVQWRIVAANYGVISDISDVLTQAGGTHYDEVSVFFSWDKETGKVYLVVDVQDDARYDMSDTLDPDSFPDDAVVNYRYRLYKGAQSANQKGFTQVSVEVGTYIDDDKNIDQLMSLLPYFPEEWLGYDEDVPGNVNIEIDVGKEIIYDTRMGMIKFSSVGGRTFPDMNFLFAKGKTVRLIPAPSYLRDREYMNTVIAFGEDFRQRILLHGEPGNWQAQVNDILIDDKLHFGLPESCKDTLLMVADTLYWLSGNKFISESSNGLSFLNYRNGIKTLDIPYPDRGCKYAAFYNAIDNQIYMYLIRELLSFALNKTSISLCGAGSTFQLEGIFDPLDYPNQEIIWESAHPAIASVTADGLVEYQAPGITIITGTTVMGNKVAQCTVYCGDSVPAEAPSSGSGTEFDPYIVNTPGNIRWISENAGEWDKWYRQTDHLDMINSKCWNWDGTKYLGFSPIGTFTEIDIKYDGQGFMIYDLYINRPTTNYVGLFGNISLSGELRGIYVENFTISGQDYVGAVCGKIVGVTVHNAIEDASICSSQISGRDYVGGVCGHYTAGANRCFVDDSFVTGRDYVGGVFGKNLHPATSAQTGDQYVDNSYANNTTVSGENCVGGFAGENYCSHTSYTPYPYYKMRYCWANCEVIGIQSVGGFVGVAYLQGTPTSGTEHGYLYYINCYSKSSVERLSGTSESIGSFVGLLKDTLSSSGFLRWYFTNCYATGLVQCGAATNKGFLGIIERTGSFRRTAYFENSYFDMDTTGQLTSAGDETSSEGKKYPLGKTTIEMTTYPYYHTVYVTWDFVTIWSEDPSKVFNQGYPYLRNNPPA